MAKRNTLRQRYYKETGLHWKRIERLEAKPTTEYCKWLENELLTEQEQVKNNVLLHNVVGQSELLLGFQKSEYFSLYEQGALEYKDAIEKYLA